MAKGNPTGFLDGDDEEMVTQWGYDWRERKLRKVIEEEWEEVARFLLTNTFNFVDDKLVEGTSEMKEYDLLLRILGEDGSVDGGGRRAISKAF